MRSTRRTFLKVGAGVAAVAAAGADSAADGPSVLRESERRLRFLSPPDGSPPDLLSRPSPPVTPFRDFALDELRPPVARPLFVISASDSETLSDELWWEVFRDSFLTTAERLRSEGFATPGAWTVRGEELTSAGTVRFDIGDPPDPTAHQRFFEFRPRKFYVNREVEFLWTFHDEYGPDSWSWGYHNVFLDDDDVFRATRPCSPGPTFHAWYGEPILTRRINDLPEIGNEPGHARLTFCLPSTTSHLHNAHTASESDGYPSDWINPGEFWDHHYGNFASGNDDREKLSTLWYHDHRMDFTASNVYAGLDGFYLLFDERDAHDGDDGNRGADKGESWLLPSHDYDIPLIFHDLLFAQEAEGGAQTFTPDQTTRWTFESSQDWTDFAGTSRGAVLADGTRKAIVHKGYAGTGPSYNPSPQIIFDGFNTDGIIGDRWTVNRRVQPRLSVEPRKYRLRLLNGGPSRFYEFFLHAAGAPAEAYGRAMSDPEAGEPTTELDHPFIVICGDGNFQPNPVLAHSIYIGVAQRVDVIIDFSKYADSTVYLVNRLEQEHGRGPSERKIDPKDYATDDDFYKANAPIAFAVGPMPSGAVLPDFGEPAPGDHDPSAFPMLFRDFPPVDFTEVRRERIFEFDYHGGLWTINGNIFDPNRVDAGIEQDSAEIWTLRNGGNGWHHPIHSHFTEFIIIEQDSQPFLRGTIQTQLLAQDSAPLAGADAAARAGLALESALADEAAPAAAPQPPQGSFTSRRSLAEIFRRRDGAVPEPAPRRAAAPSLDSSRRDLDALKGDLADRLRQTMPRALPRERAAAPLATESADAAPVDERSIDRILGVISTLDAPAQERLLLDAEAGAFDRMLFRSYDFFALWVEIMPLLGLGYPKVDRFLGGARRDVALLLPNTEVTIFARWKDFMGRHIMHCHNVVHEDHAMMVRWDIVPQGEGFDIPQETDLIAQSPGDRVEVARRVHIESHPLGGAHAPDDH